MTRRMASYCRHGALIDAGDFCDKEDEQDCPLCFIESFPARNQKIHDALADKDRRIAGLEKVAEAAVVVHEQGPLGNFSEWEVLGDALRASGYLNE